MRKIRETKLLILVLVDLNDPLHTIENKIKEVLLLHNNIPKSKINKRILELLNLVIGFLRNL